MYETLPYSIVVPALVLRDRNEAIIDFERAPLDLANLFCIELWFKPVAYPQEDSWAILGAGFETASGTKDELVLRLGAQHLTPFFQHRLEPLPKVPPLGQWTHLALAYNRGQWRQAMYPHEEQKYYEGNAHLDAKDYRLTWLSLRAMKSAENWFAELRLWQSPKDQKDLADNRYRPLDGSEPGLIGYWKLDEGSGTLMVDSSDRGNDGKIQGGEWRRDSGLQLQMGTFSSGGRRSGGVYDSGRLTLEYGQARAQWTLPPRLALQIAHLETLVARRQQVKGQLHNPLQALRSEVSTLKTTEAGEENKLTQKQQELAEAEQQERDKISTKREEIDSRKAKTLDDIESSRKIHLKDFILRLQEDMARGRESIRKEYGRVYGLDSVSMDVKVVPGVGGVGLHLPDPDTRIDPGRLSTLKLRFRAVPAEGEEKARLSMVPWLEGGTEDFARRKLAQAGFRVAVVYQEVVDPVQDGRILAQIYDVKEGGQAELDSVITLVVGRRP
ncbi:MAG: hypothetical protein ACT4QB_21930 [Gammaproteobacteria bacterium]